MTKQEFKNYCKDKIIYLDGAMGSNLMKKGMPQGVCPEHWILEHKDVVLELQKAYVNAGTNILYAPTFTANRPKLYEYGLSDSLNLINRDIVALSKQAADGKALVAGDITMTGIPLKPIGSMEFDELVEIYKEQGQALVEAGVDLFVVETMMSLQECRAAVLALKEVSDLPIMVTMTFEQTGKSQYGTDAKTAAIVMAAMGVDAIGANCSSGPDKLVDVIREMSDVVDIPIIAKPNAGLPFVDSNGETAYDMSAEEFAVHMSAIVEAGATIIGGCCGTTPEYIKETVSKNYLPAKKERVTGVRHLTSERKTFSFGLDDSFFVIGERINPTGKKALQEELRAGNLSRVLQFASEQEENGAKVLDVNLGMSGVDEKALMCQVVDLLLEESELPLCIDSSHVDVIEAALRRYPGRALINSISLETEKFEKLLPIAKKYGAMFILLPLSDKGLPESLEEKIGIIETIQAKALSMGFTKEDIIVDGLVTTVGANPMAGIETLETIAYCKENGYATTCGLSNISFGLPERGYINAAFLSMAITKGLTMAIANPNQTLLMDTALACNLLNRKENSDIVYIEAINAQKEAGILADNKNVSVLGKSGNDVKKDKTTLSSIELLKEAVLKGRRNDSAEIAKKCVEEGNNPQELLNNVLIPAINEVGDLFEKGKYFLPQLIAAAETMKNAIEVLEPLMQKTDSAEQMPVVIIATVSGDIHDIGKNLVALMLKNYGFRVIDLGKDVDRDTIIETAIKEDAKLIALSALMTTTMKEMKEVIDLAKEKGVTAKFLIGGAVITQDYADEIHADAYGKDAAEAVKCASRLLRL